jgi:anti-sigma B factor antagonist
MSDHRAGHEDVLMSIEITVRTVGVAVIVAPHGDVDLTTADLLRSTVDGVIDDGASALVLDLSDVGFMDSTALGVLVGAHRRLGNRLIVAGARATVYRLLEITNFTALLRLADSVDTALIALTAQRSDPG